MNKLCIQYGSTLQGRVVAARDLLNITKNTPIMVNDSIILFPTKSIRHIDCMYINYFEVEALMKRDKGCVITFKDCQKLELGVSYEKMKNRLALCERFSFILKNEKKVFTL
jgi:competence protein ComK